ncbi:Grx4 family monothiol glutaredoxin [Lysobacter sp. GX 14042]|uniref:Grx4 family monothiol glutaredoxin n=1 Tax=Lysobacter sp. GX 14042 TaxID=2907155 RepID=UPI001F3CD616|nr:Grx4 family monothiol glutaredoxin [Lysobacter sp. GX 14042]MCE7033001.1 Grx4 family monothiol glutaredoxin [Lysobacter sp. GX 14042]
MQLDPALRSRIESLLNDNRVVLFMKGEPGAPQCGFSAKAVGALGATGVEYAHVNVLADQDIREGIKAFGQWPTIPQLYIQGELVGGSDIIEQMANSGELYSALGVPAPDRTPPAITIGEAAAEMLRQSIDNAGEGYVLQVDIDPRYNARLQLAPVDPSAITSEAAGLKVQFDLASAQRARGLSIDWVDDERGRGLVIENPNAPPKVKPLAPAEAARKAGAGELVLVDVRPASERGQASVNVPFRTLDREGGGAAELEKLPKDTEIAFLCHSGQRSGSAAEHFRGLGFTRVYNVAGGIDAWAQDVDSSIPRY